MAVELKVRIEMSIECNWQGEQVQGHAEWYRLCQGLWI